MKQTINIIFIFSFSLVALFFIGCSKKDVNTMKCPDNMPIDTSMVIDTMVVDTMVTIEPLFINDTVHVENFIDTLAKTYIIIRHAEYINIAGDPELSEVGIARANRLVEILSSIELDAVYTTDFNRTIQTATPTVIDKGLDLIIYDPDEMFDLFHLINNDESRKLVLVVGHADSTAELLNILTLSNDYELLSSIIFDNFFIANTYPNADTEVIHFKY